MRRSLVLLLLSVAIAYSAEQAVKIDSYTHQVLAPPSSAGAPADFDFTGRTVIGIGGGGTPGGSTGYLQYNNAGAFGGIAPDAGAANQFLTGISSTGITKAQPSFSNLSGSIAPGQQNIPVGKSLYVDAVNGNDGTALSGRFDKPFLTVTAAVAAASSGDVIYIGPGSFSIGSNLQLPSGVSLSGSGMDVTTLTGSAGTPGVALSPGTGSVISDLTIDNATSPTGSGGAFGAMNTNNAFTSATVNRCNLKGGIDGVYFDKTGLSATVEFRDCFITTAYDAVAHGANTLSGTYDFYNCSITTTGTGNPASRPVSVNKATWRFFGGKLTGGGSTAQNRVVGATGTAVVELYGCKIKNTNGGSDNVDLEQGNTATLAVSAVSKEDGTAPTTSGTITQLSRYALRDNNLSDLTSAATARTNLGLGSAAVDSESALTKADDTNVTLTLGGSPATALLHAASITAGWTGTLAMSRGGLGTALTDPNANRLIGWDDTDNANTFITLGTNLTYDHATHTLNASGGGGTPGGANTQVQFNDSGAFGGDAGLTYDKVNNVLTTTDGQFVATATGSSAGTASAPAFTVKGNASFTNGLIGCDTAGGGIGFVSSGTEGARFAAGHFWLGPSSLVLWGAGLGSNDVAITRNAPGVLEINNTTAGQWGGIKCGTRDAQTNVVATGLTVAHQTTGTAAASFGEAIQFNLDSSTSADQPAGALQVIWTDATHATRTSRMDIRAVVNGSVNSVASFFAAGLSGGMSVGNVTNPGSGIISANTGYWVGTAASTSGKILKSDGAAFKASTETYAAPGVSGSQFRSDGTNWTSQVTPYGVVTSTVDQTAAAETAHVIYTVPANSAAAGTTYRITAWGNIDNGTTAITFTPRIRWGGTAGVQLIATPTVVGTTTALTGKTWKAVADVTIRTIGATGTAFCNLTVSNHTASTTGAYAQDQADSTATGVTIDTTANKDLDLTWALSAITGTPHVRTYGGYVEIIN